jgi:hypothetical protein
MFKSPHNINSFVILYNLVGSDWFSSRLLYMKFLADNPGVPGSITGAARFSEELLERKVAAPV